MKKNHIRSIVLDLILSIITCYLYNIWVQANQMDAVNEMLAEEKYSFIKWFFFSLITCGLYHLYHEYIKSEDIATCCGRHEGSDGIINLLLTLFGLGIVADAIQQGHINKYFENKN